MKVLLLSGTVALAMTLPAGWSSQVGDNPPIPPSWNQRPGQSPTPNATNSQKVEDPADRMIRERQAALSLNRQEQAKADAAKLVELATELKKQVDGATGTTVSAESGKAPETADAIIKLAKSVKSKLKPF